MTSQYELIYSSGGIETADKPKTKRVEITLDERQKDFIAARSMPFPAEPNYDAVVNRLLDRYQSLLELGRKELQEKIGSNWIHRVAFVLSSVAEGRIDTSPDALLSYADSVAEIIAQGGDDDGFEDEPNPELAEQVRTLSPFAWLVLVDYYEMPQG